MTKIITPKVEVATLLPNLGFCQSQSHFQLSYMAMQVRTVMQVRMVMQIVAPHGSSYPLSQVKQCMQYLSLATLVHSRDGDWFGPTYGEPKPFFHP